MTIRARIRLLHLLLFYGVLNRFSLPRWGRHILQLMLAANILMLIASGVLQSQEMSLNTLHAWTVFSLVIVVTMLWLGEREKQQALCDATFNEAVAGQRATLEKQDRDISERFLTMLLHESRTSLAIIGLAASSLERRIESGADDAKRIRHINGAVDDLNAMIDRCVQADQIDGHNKLGAASMQVRGVCLRDLIDEVLQSLDARRITLIMPPACTLQTDAHFLRVIVQNLLSNALKYSPPDSMIEFNIAIAERHAGSIVRFEIVNAVGKAGMPDPARLFARYYRAEAARRHVGAGLGLWLAQSLAGQLGSTIHFYAGPASVHFNFELEQA